MSERSKAFDQHCISLDLERYHGGDRTSFLQHQITTFRDLDPMLEPHRTLIKTVQKRINGILKLSDADDIIGIQLDTLRSIVDLVDSRDIRLDADLADHLDLIRCGVRRALTQSSEDLDEVLDDLIEAAQQRRNRSESDRYDRISLGL